MNPSSATVYVPGASPSIVTEAPGAAVTVFVVGPLTITWPESRVAPRLAGMMSDSAPPPDGVMVGSLHAAKPARVTATTRVTERIRRPHGLGNVMVMLPVL